MKRVPQFGWLAIVGLYFLAFCPGASGQTTWYVRSDGGTATQCTGKTYAAYPGSGSAQPCAYNHPLWLVTQIPSPGSGTSGGSVRFAGGDIVLIRNTDTFEIGKDEPTGAAAAAGCNSDPADCTFPSFPAGTSGAHTVFAGTGDGSTVCSGTQRPKLTAEADSDNGGNFIYSMLQVNPLDQNSAATNYIDYKCLELQGWTTNPAVANYPRYGFQNVKGYGDSTHPPANHISFVNVYMHGWANVAVQGEFQNVTATNLRLERNGGYGWNMDIGDNIAWNTGTWTMTNVTLRWNGCLETTGLTQINCASDTDGPPGPGSGFSSTGGAVSGTFTIDWEQPIVENNTKDGIDMLHCSASCVITVNRGLFDGNGGNQLKGTAAVITYTNNIIVGNCAIWKSGGANYRYERNGGSPTFDWCRAYGDVVSGGSVDGGTLKILHNTITGQGNYALDEGCGSGITCSTGPTITIQNNIIIGDVSQTAPGHRLNTIYQTGGTVVEDHNDWYTMDGTGGTGGTGDIYTNPLLMNYSDSAALDAHETVNSPTRAAGTNDGLTLDYAGNPRPQGKGWDMGAYQFGGSAATPNKPNPPPNVKVVVE